MATAAARSRAATPKRWARRGVRPQARRPAAPQESARAQASSKRGAPSRASRSHGWRSRGSSGFSTRNANRFCWRGAIAVNARQAGIASRSASRRAAPFACAGMRGSSVPYANAMRGRACGAKLAMVFHTSRSLQRWTKLGISPLRTPPKRPWFRKTASASYTCAKPHRSAARISSVSRGSNATIARRATRYISSRPRCGEWQWCRPAWQTT